VTFFGSWVIAFDAAGQVRRGNNSPVLTLAAVAVPQENVDGVRALLTRQFAGQPVKWKEGRLPGFHIATGIVVGQTLPVAVTHVMGISGGRWQRFWDEAHQTSQRLKEMTGDTAAFASGSEAVRLLLFSAMFAHAMAHVLKRRGWRAPAPQQRPDAVEFAPVFDTDVQSPEARGLLADTLGHFAEKGSFVRTANLELKVSGSVQTEQQEPLILLADYVAGALNHVHRDAVMSKPVAPLEEVGQAVERFRRAHGVRLQEIEMPFDEVYPLTSMWERP
jgi:hypothetical protein